jgi:hypothetical protein
MQKLLGWLFPPKLPVLDTKKAMPEVLGYHNRINRTGINPICTDAVRVVKVTEHAPLKFKTVSGK